MLPRTRFIAFVLLLGWVSMGSTAATSLADNRIGWGTFAQAKERFSSAGKEVEFPKELTTLDRKRVTIQGFRVPLAVKTHFLLASKPSDCDHCIEGGPASYGEVFSKEPMKPTFGRPLTVAGRLELLKSDPGGIYYRLVDAELVTVD
jgi:hypothetical protein